MILKDFKKRTEEFCKFRPSTIDNLEIYPFFRKQVKIASEKSFFNPLFRVELVGSKTMAKFLLFCRRGFKIANLFINTQTRHILR